MRRPNRPAWNVRKRIARPSRIITIAMSTRSFHAAVEPSLLTRPSSQPRPSRGRARTSARSRRCCRRSRLSCDRAVRRGRRSRPGAARPPRRSRAPRCARAPDARPLGRRSSRRSPAPRRAVVGLLGLLGRVGVERQLERDDDPRSTTTIAPPLGREAASQVDRLARLVAGAIGTRIVRYSSAATGPEHDRRAHRLRRGTLAAGGGRAGRR